MALSKKESSESSFKGQAEGSHPADHPGRDVTSRVRKWMGNGSSQNDPSRQRTMTDWYLLVPGIALGILYSFMCEFMSFPRAGD